MIREADHVDYPIGLPARSMISFIGWERGFSYFRGTTAGTEFYDAHEGNDYLPDR